MASPPAAASGVVLSLPPLSNEALSYWIGPSQLIDSVAVTGAASTNDHEPSPCATVYTRYTLQGILLFCGIKQHRVHQTVDQMIAQTLSTAFAASQTSPMTSPCLYLVGDDAGQETPARPAALSSLLKDWLSLPTATMPPNSPVTHPHQPLNHYPHRYQLCVPPAAWERIVIKALGNELRGQMICLRPLLRWSTACAKQCGHSPVVILIGGTSGSGKSTLARLVASQLRIANVLSTDTVRQVLRARMAGREADYPTLFLSTYEAYKAVGERATEAHPQEVVRGYVSQCELVLQVLDGMLKRLLARRESAVIEGVHLLPWYLTAKRAELLISHVTCVPILVQIPKADSHLERFCIRSRGMSLQSDNNKYIASFQAIRAIQNYLVTTVEDAAMPVLVLSNTNVDKSFLVLHHAVLETMEHTALHGWPADAAAAVQVPLTPLAFAATKRRLVAVVRQRRAHRSTTAGPVTGKGKRYPDDIGGSGSGAVASRDGCSRLSPTAPQTAAAPLPAEHTDLRAAPQRRAIGEVYYASAPAYGSFVTCVADASAALHSRARSADLLGSMPRRPTEHSGYQSCRPSGSPTVEADKTSCGSRPPPPSEETTGCSHTQGPQASSLNPSSSTPTSVGRCSVHPSPTMSNTEASPFVEATTATTLERVSSSYRASAPRRSTTTSILQPGSLNAHLTSRNGEEAFDDLEVPSLMGS
jgi:2-phosphoglycerate kinase